MKKTNPLTVSVRLAILAVILFFPAGHVAAEPSKGQVTKMWENQYKNAKVLDIKSKGGERLTKQLHNKHYITPIGTCWDYDVTEMQKCGCRLFSRASVCCRKGSSTDCEIRIGNSTPVDCTKFGKPKYGLSGNTEPQDCRERRVQMDCNKRRDLVFGPGSAVGPCYGTGGVAQDWPPAFVCPNGQNTVLDFHNGKCGPTPEDCGCRLVEECSSEEGLSCYRNWKNKLGR
ncbi:MAG: hypothetical protein WCX84_08990 [Syntrophales bacterium]|jgi:hypothetical protein|nr:hypothetical protein [Syntrophales bacterium]